MGDFREWARVVLGEKEGDRLADQYASAIGTRLDHAIFHGTQPQRLSERATALLRAMEVYAIPVWVIPTGVEDQGGSAPHWAQKPLTFHTGEVAPGEAPLTQGPIHPVLPQSVENHSQKEKHVIVTATPKDNRDAWLKLVSHLERHLISTRENAKGQASFRRLLAEETGHQTKTTEADWQATAWAAQRLLDAIQGLPVPEVPVDHAEGQASILDALAGGAPRVEAERLGLASSTSGDEPVEYRPRRLLDRDGDLWEELEDGRWGYCPWGSEATNDGPYTDGLGSAPWGPVYDQEALDRWHGPLRDPIGDEYDKGAR